jgi:competence protein ComEA
MKPERNIQSDLNLDKGVNRMKTINLALIALCLSLPAFASPVNINKASAEQIAQALKGIGIKKAQAIVSYRNKNGAFKKNADIVAVKGIGASIFKNNSKDIKLK